MDTLNKRMIHTLGVMERDHQRLCLSIEDIMAGVMVHSYNTSYLVSKGRMITVHSQPGQKHETLLKIN
jgi:hypothetical protein